MCQHKARALSCITRPTCGESVAQWLEFLLLVHEAPGSNPGWEKLAGIYTLGLKCLKLIGNNCRSNSNSSSPSLCI